MLLETKENKELPILSTNGYVFDHKRVAKQKRKINKEIKRALRVVQKFQ